MLAIEIGNKSIVIDQIAYITQQTDTDSTSNWVSSVSATGTFTKPAGTSIPTGTSGIPSGWTVVDV